MAITDESNSNGFYMPVAPAYGGGQGGFGGFGGDWGWIILLLLCGWGGMGMGGFGGFGGYGNMMLGYDFPWLLNGQNGINNNVNDGFRSAQLSDSITSVRDGVSGLATQLCGCCGDIQMGLAGVNQNISNGTAAIQNSLCQGFAGTTAAVTGAQNAITTQMYNNEIASLNRSFAEQTANVQGFNGVQAQLAQCCCDNRLATAQTQNIIQVEAAASRASASADTQKILDKLCALELDGVKGQLAQAQRENVALQNAVNMATMQASQTAQTAQILAGQAAEIDGVYNRLKNCPVGTYNVCNPLTPSGGCPSCAGY